MHTLTIQTRGRGTLDITAEVDALVRDSGIKLGLCTAFIQHTSASLLITENSTPTIKMNSKCGRARDGHWSTAFGAYDPSPQSHAPTPDVMPNTSTQPTDLEKSKQ